MSNVPIVPYKLLTVAFNVTKLLESKDDTLIEDDVILVVKILVKVLVVAFIDDVLIFEIVEFVNTRLSMLALVISISVIIAEELVIELDTKDESVLLSIRALVNTRDTAVILVVFKFVFFKEAILAFVLIILVAFNVPILELMK